MKRKNGKVDFYFKKPFHGKWRSGLLKYIYDGIQAISDGKIGWSKFLVKNHPGPLRIHILIGIDPKNCLKFSKKVNLVKSTKAKMAISEILPFSGKIVIAAKRKGLKRSPIC